MTAACHGRGSRTYASLSFQYLPMAAQSPAPSKQQLAPRSPHDSFQFFVDVVGGEICFAEDVFFDGKLVPFGLPPLPPARAPAKSVPLVDHRRSASLDAATQRPQGRSSKSGELRRASSDSSSALKSPPPTTGSMARPVRWQVFVLGGAKVPATMEMRDIRSRQRRRRTPAPAAAAAAKGSGEWRREGKDVSWRILRSLSCNAEGSSALAVAPPACYVPHVRGCGV